MATRLQLWVCVLSLGMLTAVDVAAVDVAAVDVAAVDVAAVDVAAVDVAAVDVAAQPALRLEWQAPAECPEAAVVHADVLRLVGDQGAASPDVVAHAQVRQLASGSWELQLHTEVAGQTGVRALQGDSCSALARALAVTLALMLNPDQALQEQPQDEPAEPKPSEPMPEWRVEGALLLAATEGVLPSPSVAGGFGLLAGLGAASLQLSADASLVQRAEQSDAAGRGGALWLTSARAAGCWAWGAARTLAVCGVSRTFRLQGSGRDIAEPEVGVVWWTSLGAAVAGRLELSPRWQAQLDLEAAAALARPQLYIEDFGRVHRPEGWHARAELSAVYRLW